MNCQHGWTLTTLPERRAAAVAMLARCEAAGVAVEAARECLEAIDVWARAHGAAREVAVSVDFETGEMLVTETVGGQELRGEYYNCGRGERESW